MRKEFNITGLCVPKKHYMVNLDSRLKKMKKMVDNGNYFAITRARQYGKTTILAALADFTGDCPRDHMVLVPYDIAVDFNLDMSFSKDDIAGMLQEYESDEKTGMDIDTMAGLIYEETSGYPFLVCRLCKIMDEEL